MKQNSRHDRKAAIAPFAALLLIPLLGMIAFGVDVGWITHTKNELQAAADSAALAGANCLTDGFVKYYLPNVTTDQKKSILASASSTARTTAQQYASYNSAGGVNSLTLLDSDIELGYTNASGVYTPLSTYAGYPNTVTVIMRRDVTANGPLGLFFAQVLGINTADIQVTAAATIYSGSISGFGMNPVSNSRILPVTYDVNHWNNFLLTGQDPDGNTSFADNSLPQLAVYPSIKFTGNFGQLTLDQGNDGSSVIRDWISNGVPSSDLQAEYTKGLLPLSSHDSNSPPDWKGNPGLKDSTIHEVGHHINELYLLPLYKPVVPTEDGYQAGSGSGSNYYYTIVQFVGISISYVDSQGGTKAIKVQPSALMDPNALYDTVSPASPPTNSTSGTTSLTTTFSGAKLVR